MKYDDASWHYDGSFPDDLPPERGATHMGMFMVWTIDNDLVSDFVKEDLKEQLEKIKQRKLTGSKFIMEECDEKLFADLFNDVGNEFAEDYYESDYFNDYCDILGDTIGEDDDVYLIEDNWGNYDTVKQALDKKFKEWHDGGSEEKVEKKNDKDGGDVEEESLFAKIINMFS